MKDIETKRKIKLIVTDIDGTIANDKNEISQGVRNCFERLKKSGVKVVVATGRMLPASQLMARRLNLDTPLISYQGATVHEQGCKKPLFANYVKKELAVEIVKFLKERNIHFQAYINDEIYVEHDNDIVKAYSKKMETGYNVVKDVLELDLSHLPKILAINMNSDVVANLRKEAMAKFKDEMCITLSTPYFCEFTNPNAHKGEALRLLANYYKIPLEQTMAFGDQKNDITMIKTAGIGVAVGNATQELKDNADFVTKTIDEDGVVYAIEKFVDFGVENVKI